MKRYTITVNGTAYDVTVDEANGAAPAPVAAAPAAAPAPAPKAAPAPAAQGAIKVEAPMPGTILDVKVSNGASVNAGDVLCILEAMKMENEIVAPEDGIVALIQVSAGMSVEAGDILAALNV